MGELRCREQTYRLRGLIYQVRNELRAGWSEEVYHQALVQLLKGHDIPVVSKQRQSLCHREVEVHTFEPDLIVWDKIVLELKALPYQARFSGEHYAQLIHYLKIFGKGLGLLVNFGPTRVKIKRVFWNEPELDLSEYCSKFKSYLSEQDRECLLRIRRYIIQIAQQYGLGYPETVYRRLVEIELLHHHLSCVSEFEVPVKWHGAMLAYHKIPHLLVADRYLVHIRSLLKHITEYDLTRTNTYLKNLGLKFGFVVNFGPKQLQIYGVRSD